MSSCNGLSFFDNDVSSLSLDVDLEVKSESEEDERSNDDSYSDPGSLVVEVREISSSVDEEDSDYLEDEPEVDISNVVVPQELVEVPLDPSLLLYVKRNAKQPEQGQVLTSDLPKNVKPTNCEKPNTITKALREVKRHPRERRNLIAEAQKQPLEQSAIKNNLSTITSSENDNSGLTKPIFKNKLNEEEQSVETRGSRTDSSIPEGIRRKRGQPKKVETADNEGSESEGWNSQHSYEDGDVQTEIDRLNVASEKSQLKGDKRKRLKKKEERGDEEKPEYYECADCGRKFREKSHLATHSRAHIDIRNFKCNQCGCLFKTKTNLYFHSKTHSEVPFTCEKCNKTYPERKMLKRHIRVVHSSERFGCDQCGRCFKSSANLALHYTLHTGAKPYSCEACDKGFVYKSTYTAHMKAHDADNRFACDQCPSRKDCHHHSEARPWLCTVCGKAYPLKGTLKNHMKIHEPEKPYRCSQCPKSFMKKQSFECHMKQHRGERPEYMCDQCSQSYFNVFALKRHYMKHTGERGFTCQVCQKAFWMKDALRVHMRTHSSVKMFPCSECPKAFAHKHTLDAHARTHSVGAQPYSCSVCAKGFVHKYNLVRHERQHIVQPHPPASFPPSLPPIHTQAHTLHIL